MRPAFVAVLPLMLLLGLGASQVGRDTTPPGLYLELAGGSEARVGTGASIELLVSASEPATLEVAYGEVRLEQVAQEIRIDLLAEPGRLPARVRATDAAGNSSEGTVWIEGIPEPELTLTVGTGVGAGDPLGVRASWRSAEPVASVEIRVDGVPLRSSRVDPSGAAERVESEAGAEGAPGSVAESTLGSLAESTLGSAAEGVPADLAEGAAAAAPASGPTVSAAADPGAPAAVEGSDPVAAAAPLPLAYAGETWAFTALPLNAVDGALEVELRLVDALGRERFERATVSLRANPQPIEELNLSGSILSVITPEGRALEAETLAAAYAASLPAPLWREPFLLPIDGRGTSGYGGPRRYAPGGPVSYHQGEDIAAPAGTPVLATNRGVVRVAGMYPIKGGLVVIDHGGGVVSLYFHQQRVDVQVGDEVARGQPIGEVGSTGLSTGPHLHWEMRVFERPTNPLAWVGAIVP